MGVTVWFVELGGPVTACDCSAFTFSGLQAGKARKIWQPHQVSEHRWAEAVYHNGSTQHES